jgi:aerotaxis receptor
MQDMHQDDVVSSCEEQELIYHDGSRRKVLVADQEVPFPEGKLIVSRTNEQGVLTHGNQSFVEMSGFTEEELIGQPHHILRHPDMPKAAFKDLWNTLARGEKWTGYVKNLRKDGAYYWVLATVVANIRGGAVVGYTSVRRKPSRQRIAECIEQYRQMRAEENS